jgi:hypothetical protein
LCDDVVLIDQMVEVDGALCRILWFITIIVSRLNGIIKCRIEFGLGVPAG